MTEWQKPSGPSAAVFIAACVLVGFMSWLKMPESAKLAATLIGLVGTWVVAGPQRGGGKGSVPPPAPADPKDGAS